MNQAVKTGFSYHTVRLPDGEERKYALFIPPQYDQDPRHRWPVILFLHGSGERGTDGIRHTQVGLPAYIADRQDRFPFITVMPQARDMWFRGDEAVAVGLALEGVMSNYRADPDRIYLTGLSMGGVATWEMAAARPDVFAAIVPVCGVGQKEVAANLRDLPIWAFHGAKDDRVPVAGSRRPIEALRKLGAKPRYTEYADGNHFVWDRAYATEELYPWLLRHRRRPPPPVIDYRLLGSGGQAWWLSFVAEKRPSTTPHIRAEADGEGKVKIESTGVATVMIQPDAGPIKTGDEVTVTWNGREVFSGQCRSEIVCTSEASSKPASR